MHKKVKIKYIGMLLFLLDIIIQGHCLFGRSRGGWIYDDSLRNAFIILCAAVIMFGESKFAFWLAFIGLLLVIVLTTLFFVLFFRNKKCFLIPLCLMCVNALFHIGSYWDVPLNYPGLIYKIISCVIFGFLVYEEYGKKRPRESGLRRKE
jgi:hypothetical protein